MTTFSAVSVSDLTSDAACGCIRTCRCPRASVVPFSKTERTRAMAQRPPVPPFTAETAARKVRAAEDAWNTRDPQKVALAYTEDSRWRNRSQFINGRQE